MPCVQAIGFSHEMHYTGLATPPLRRQALASAVAILGGSWVAWTLSQSNGLDSSLPSLPSLPVQTIKTRLWSRTSRSWGANHCCRSQNTCSKVPGNSHWTWWTAVTSLNDTRPTRVNSNCQDHAVQLILSSTGKGIAPYGESKDPRDPKSPYEMVCFTMASRAFTNSKVLKRMIMA